MKCSNSDCSKYFFANIKYSCYLEFDASLTGKISDIIMSYFQINSINSNYDTCIHCLYNVKGIKNLSFLARPKYLLIYFKGDVITNKILDDKLDFNNECFPNTDNIGPKQYSLFAFIKKNNLNYDYNAFIKIGAKWYIYNAKNLVKAELHGSITVQPYIVIYKGEEKKNN